MVFNALERKEGGGGKEERDGFRDYTRATVCDVIRILDGRQGYLTEEGNRIA